MVNHIVKTLFGYISLPFSQLKKLWIPTKPKQSFTEAITEIVDFNKFISQQECPNCKKKEVFTTIGYERGKNGFEAQVFCTGCRTKAIVNSTGFHYEVRKVPGGKAE